MAGTQNVPESGTGDSEPSSAVIETHVSVVFLHGDRAVKRLKPLTTPYLDYGTTAARLTAVDAELELNRRLAPDVYLGHADVVERGEVVDRLLVMRRLPADRRLTALLDRPGADDALREVARAVAAFHAGLPPLGGDGTGPAGGERAEIEAIAGRDAVAANWRANHDDLSSSTGTMLDRDVLDRVAQLSTGYLDHHGPLFRQRIRDGWIRDGHGDLTAEDVFVLDDGPRIIDCLAFRRSLRISDVLADIGFLAMDIDRLAGPERARWLMAWYRAFSGEHHPSSLAHHYVAYRAQVRAKVETLRHRQGADGAIDRAHRYLALTLDHLERAQPTVVLLGGAPGVGKSTVAERAARALGFVPLDSDSLRKDLAGRAHHDVDRTGLDAGSHDPERDEATYRELVERTRSLLGRGESVVLDASWADGARRASARRMARDEGAVCVEVECDVDADVARHRVERRLAGGGSPSDALPELLDELRRRRHPWPEARRLDTGGPVEVVVEAALGLIDAARRPPATTG